MHVFPEFICENLNAILWCLKVSLWEALGPEGRVLMRDVSALTERDRREMKIQKEESHLQTRRWPYQTWNLLTP